MKRIFSINNSHRSLALAIIGWITIMCIAGCQRNNLDELFRNRKGNTTLTGTDILYPKPGTLFPPEFPSPKFIWNDTINNPSEWHYRLFTESGEEIHSGKTNTDEWRPDSDLWEKIKSQAIGKPLIFALMGEKRSLIGKKYYYSETSFAISADSVGADIFYRSVPLPFGYAVKHVNEIEWYLGNTRGDKPTKILDNVPVCANCHSFSANGTVAMDVDYANDKGSYIISPLQDTIHLTFDKIITWSDYKREEGGLTFGLLSQISPNANYVLSTVKDRSVFVPVDNLEYSQLFFPIKGIVAVYDRKNKKYSELSGASDKDYVQSNPNWSPDGKEVLFARANRYKSTKIENSQSVLLKIEDVKEFINGKQEFKFDVYKVPFNNGAGGKAEPVSGASNNNKSNFFARYSPDGKWIVFCQANNFMLLQPDSKLYIIPATGGEARMMNCNTGNMNSWHSWSPNSKWLVFSTKDKGPYTQLYMTHIDENGQDSPPVFLENLFFEKRAANIPEFVNHKFPSLQRMVDDFSKSALYYTRMGSMNLGEKLYRDAQENIEYALKLDSSYFEAYEQKLRLNFFLRRSKCKNEIKDRLLAKTLIDKRIKNKPDDISLYIKRGNLQLLLGNTNEALSDAQKVLNKRANDYDALELISVVYRTQGLPLKAVDYQKRLLQLQPDNVTLTYNLANLYKEANQIEKALSILNEVINRFPNDAGIYISRAELFLLTGNEAAAKTDFDKAVSTEPMNYVCYRARGMYYLKKAFNDLARNDFAKALELINISIKENPQNAPLYSIRAELADYAGNREEAILFYEDALKNWPLNYTVLKKLGDVYFFSKQYPLSINKCAEIIDNFPEADATIFCRRGMSYEAIGDMKRALYDYNKAIELNAKDYIYYYYRSAVRSALGDKTGGINDLKSASVLLQNLQKTRKLNAEEMQIMAAIKEDLMKD